MIRIPKFKSYARDATVSEPFIEDLWQYLESNHHLISWIYQQLETESLTGLTFTGYEHLTEVKTPQITSLDKTLIEQTLKAWIYYLTLFNHPQRLKFLFKQSSLPFVAPHRKFSPVFMGAKFLGQSLPIHDLKLSPQGADRPRLQRGKALEHGPFVSSWINSSKNKGRKQARSIFAAGANPEITGNPMALASLAQAHSFASIPRDGTFKEIKKQTALALSAQEWLDQSPVKFIFGEKSQTWQKLREYYQHNLVGVLESKPEAALKRAQNLYQAGIRTFRIYSPEPNSDLLTTLKSLRQLEKSENWEYIEIAVGKVVEVKQAVELEAAGANFIDVGIGGGGRCITGVVAGLTIDWPQLVWEMRGRVKIPIWIEGGANDAIAESLAIGGSLIGVVGKLAGTIETPGGYSFYQDSKSQRLFKYYGGEASDRMRAMAGRVGPYGRIWNREGETRKKYLKHGPGSLPTLLQSLVELHSGLIAGMVFQNVRSIHELQNIKANHIKKEAMSGMMIRETH